MRVVIVSTGTANTASIVAAFLRLGCTPQVSANPNEIAAADFVVLPGVGAFAAAMENLVSRGLTDVLKDRVKKNAPLLGICLGLQLLCESSEESAGVKGLGIIPQKVSRLPAQESLVIPHMGWNEVNIENPQCRFLRDGVAYFANSYALLSRPQGFFCATTTHGDPFVSALERGNLLALQCHPELSGDWGMGVLKRWLKEAAC